MVCGIVNATKGSPMDFYEADKGRGIGITIRRIGTDIARIVLRVY